MKVLHININYTATTLHQLLIRSLEKINVQNKIFVPCHKVNLSVINPDPNVTISKCFKYYERYFYLLKQIKIYKSLIKKVNVANYSIIHAHTLFTDGGVAYKLNKKYKIPYIVAIRNTDINIFFKYMVFLRKYGFKILKNSSQIIFLSPASQKLFINKYCPYHLKDSINRKSKVIPNGIDDFWLENTPNSKFKDSNIINIIYAGTINKNKNILTTVDACNILIKKGYSVKYTVVGKVEDRKIWNIISKQKFLYYIKPQPKEELISVYRDNDIFAMPSFTETFGLVYAEALSQGLPIIYSKGQGFDDYFKNGTIGISVHSKSASEIADAILFLYNNKYKLFPKCITSGKYFNWDKICQEYANMYHDIERLKNENRNTST